MVAEDEVVRHRMLLDEDLGDPELVRSLVGALFELGAAQARVGEIPAARDSLDEGVYLSRRIAGEQPHDMALRRNVLHALRHAGAVAAEAGDLPAARQHLAGALHIAWMLHSARPHHTDQPDLPMTLQLYGQVAHAEGDHWTAVQSFAEAAEITAFRADCHADDPSWQVALQHILADLRAAGAHLDHHAAEAVAGGHLQAACDARRRAQHVSEIVRRLDPPS